MIFAFAPHFVGTVQSVLDFFHLRERPEGALPLVIPQKVKAEQAEESEELSEDESQEEIKQEEPEQAVADSDSDTDDSARDYESDDHEWMDMNYFNNDLVPRYRQTMTAAFALINAPLREAGKLLAG